jgi:HSP20 family protein
MNLMLQNGHRLRGFWPEVSQMVEQFENFRQRACSSWSAPTSIWEADDKFHVEMDVPGVSRENVGLTFEKGVLTISAERKAAEGEISYLHNERAFGQLSRTLRLPETLDPETIQAELNAGVLHVTIDKLPVAQPKKIEVKVN